jgi:hypothetical protein
MARPQTANASLTTTPAATLLLFEAVHSRLVMDLLGTRTDATTTERYSHVNRALGRDAADRMGIGLWDRLRPNGSSGHHAGTRNDESRSPNRRAAWSEGWS